MPRRLLVLGCLLSFLLLPYPRLLAQEVPPDTLRTVRLAPITITATRLDDAAQRTPMAVTSLGQATLTQGQQLLSLNPVLATVPGLFALNADNFAQDLRVSIRGFGARAAFGIRGVKLLVDGLPESTPDGQAQVDNLVLGALRSAEVIRGPASGLYGNASGGVISLETDRPPAVPSAEVRASAGAFGFRQMQAQVGTTLNQGTGLLVHANHTRQDGYRAHSAVRSTVLQAKAIHPFDGGGRLTALVNYGDSPRAEDPGSLNLNDAEDAPDQARDANVRFDAGEAVQQGRIGLIYTQPFAERHLLEVRSYYTGRSFEGRLPFANGGYIEFGRQVAGGTVSYTLVSDLAGRPYRLQAGLDADAQHDDRQRYANDEGQRGALSLDQLEQYRSMGVYAVHRLDVSPRLRLVASTRIDAIRSAADDAFLDDGDDSGERTHTAFSPMVGVQVQATPTASLYANIATSFETPALSELSANPTGGGGFNAALDPQRATNFELGVKGQVADRVRYEVAAYHIRVRDELVPFELDAFPGRSFFQNAGASQRQGLEAAVEAYPARGLLLTVAYTLARYRYTDYVTDGETLDGNRLPGLPEHLLHASLGFTHPSGWYATASTNTVGSLYADDANTERTDAYVNASFRAGWEGQLGEATVAPFIGVRNVLNTDYASNVRINAFGGRYFEPAPPRHLYGGLVLRR